MGDNNSELIERFEAGLAEVRQAILGLTQRLGSSDDKLDNVQIQVDNVSQQVQQSTREFAERSDITAVVMQEFKEEIAESVEAISNNMEKRIEDFQAEIQELKFITKTRGSGIRNSPDDSFLILPNDLDPLTKDASQLSIDQKRDRDKRRNTLFGSRDQNKSVVGPSTYAGTPQTTAITLVTRETFPNVTLKGFGLEHICIFLDEYEKIIARFTNHGLKLVDFCNTTVQQRLTLTARELNFVGEDMCSGGLARLEDSLVKTCIFEVVKAKSADDFINKISSVKFSFLDGENDFVPDALSFPILLERAMLYTHRFNRVIQLIGERAEYTCIPPLYKEGKTMGMIDYYLSNWPKDSGNLLYSRVSIEDKGLRFKETFKDFINDFFMAIKKYKDIKQSYEDLNSVFKRKNRDGNTGRSADSDNKYKERSKSQPFIKKRDNIHHLHNDAVDDTNMQTETSEDDDTSHKPKYVEETRDEDDSSLGEEILDNEGNLLAFVNPTGNPKPVNQQIGCWWKFRNGKCTNDKCALKHDTADMIALQDSKLREAITSPFSESDAVVLQKVQKLIKARTDSKQKPSTGHA